jgi:hypothetical protein
VSIAAAYVICNEDGVKYRDGSAVELEVHGQCGGILVRKSAQQAVVEFVPQCSFFPLSGRKTRGHFSYELDVPSERSGSGLYSKSESPNDTTIK